MAPYIVITTQFAVYKCHDYRIKNGRVYFNSRAINVGNVATIVLKDGSTAYSNDKITPYNARKLTSMSRRSATTDQKSVKKSLKSPLKGAVKRKSTLPDVIVL
jgi:hypothetical protein